MNENIRIKYIPALFPDLDFELYINNYYTRFYKVPTGETTIIKTAEKFALSKGIEKNGYSTNRLIQTIYYDKYLLEIFLKENQNIAAISLGEEIDIYTVNGESFKAELIEISEATALGNSYNFKVSLSVKKIADDSVINNYLTYDFLSQKYSDIQLNSIEFYNDKNIGDPNSLHGIDFEAGGKLLIYSSLDIQIGRENLKDDYIEFYNGQKMLIESQDVGVIKLRAYITDVEKYQLEKYGKRCNAILRYNDNTSIKLLDLERVDFTITNNNELINIYQADFNLYFDTVNFYKL